MDILDRSTFFSGARCGNHDKYPGGTVNHSLWVGWFAVVDYDSHKRGILPSHAQPYLASLKRCALLHDVCDADKFPFRAEWGHGGRSRDILKKMNADFTDVELSAIREHMRSAIIWSEQHVSPKLKHLSNIIEPLHIRLREADHDAIEYAQDIPFGTIPTGPTGILEENGVIHVQIHKNHKLEIGHKGGVYRLGKRFGNIECTQLRIYVTRFPDFRPSYLIAKSTADGKCHAFRIKTHIIPVRYHVPDADMDKTVSSMRHHPDKRDKQFKIKVDNSHFFQRLDLRISE